VVHFLVLQFSVDGESSDCGGRAVVTGRTAFRKREEPLICDEKPCGRRYCGVRMLLKASAAPFFRAGKRTPCRTPFNLFCAKQGSASKLRLQVCRGGYARKRISGTSYGPKGVASGLHRGDCVTECEAASYGRLQARRYGSLLKNHPLRQ
jgi:hypothetical protein